jgi:hypothetical protein
MSYRVIWRQRILHQLHTATFLILERGGDPQPLAQAVREIGSLLASAPFQAGESRSENERVLISPPLSVRFEAFESDQVVMIYEAILYPRRRLSRFRTVRGLVQ